ncbi:MAG: ABC transporter permease [Bacteroidales bacterium]|nr:ABC transporter permease [Candidatus Equimonas enterica]
MRTLLHVVLRELYRISSKREYWFSMLVAPLVCVFFFTSIMDEGLPHDMPIGIVDQDCTPTSRNLVRNLNSFEHIKIAEAYPNVTEARKATQRGDIYGFYFIPKGTTKKANRQESPVVSFYTNYTFIVAGSLLYKDMRTMSELASGAAGRKVLYARGASEKGALGFLQPIVIDSHAIGNPTLNYSIYLSNTLIPGVLMLFIFMVTVYSMGAEIKESTGEALLRAAGDNPLRALYGKLIAHALIWIGIGAIYVFYLYGVLLYPCYCGIPTMLGVMALGVFAAQGMGTLMICALPSPRLGLSFASLWGVISFSISGMSFPVMAMHPILQSLAWLFPLRHYFLLYVNCALDGFPIINAWPYVIALLAFALLPALLPTRFRNIMTKIAYKQ